MTFSLSGVNIQPLVDLIGRSGELTTEYKAFKSASLLGKIVLALSALIFVLGLAGAVFPNSHAAVVVGSIGSGLGLLAGVVASIHYQTGRQNLKANAQSILGAIQAAAADGEKLLAPTPLQAATAAPAPTPVIVNVHQAPAAAAATP